MSDITIPGGKIRSFVERIENLDSEMQELSEQKKEVFAEAKGEGFDVKILREIIKLRKEDKNERDERGTHPTSAVLPDAGYFADRVTLSLALRSSGDAGRGVGRIGAAAALVAG